jgi:hypothetical protein
MSDVATPGPRGVFTAPAVALPYSGGVRRHRRYVFIAPLIPQIAPAVATDVIARRIDLKF